MQDFFIFEIWKIYVLILVICYASTGIVEKICKTFFKSLWIRVRLVQLTLLRLNLLKHSFNLIFLSRVQKPIKNFFAWTSGLTISINFQLRRWLSILLKELTLGKASSFITLWGMPVAEAWSTTKLIIRRDLTII